jgi:hypothetical protein
MKKIKRRSGFLIKEVSWGIYNKFNILHYIFLGDR